MKKIIKNYEFKASREEVFKALTDPVLITEWSGADAIMDASQGGRFSLWGGTIIGVNTKITVEQILQDWKESKWDTHSKVTFNLNATGKSTELELVHENIPDSSLQSITAGWDQYYLGPLKIFLEH